MKKLPFGLTPDTSFFCPMSTHIEALNVLKFAIESGEALVKVTGEVGTGKTLLCRMLLNELEGKRTTAYIPYPKLSSRELKFALAKELGIRISASCRDDQLSQRIQTRLINLNKQSGPVVLVIDECQVLDAEGLETLRLFTNLETEQQKLLQIIVFAQPELDTTLQKKSLRQIRQRIVFSYRLMPLSYSQVVEYVNHRLGTAGHLPTPVSPYAGMLIYFYSRGIPRLVNILCHKALLLAFGQGKQKISTLNIVRAAKDTDSINTWIQNHTALVAALSGLLLSSSAMAIWSMS
ncbi:MAG: AAA family ATPase [Kangiellaceae bacterium]|nr:AAA family ATPase [Kangiellaceae bacterium]MCW8999642.1 AAA family ATPase [Kangiellaceae bacterium]